MRKLVTLFVLSIAFFAAQAQTAPATKIGFADVEYIYLQIPEAKQVEAELKSTQTLLQNQITAKQKEFQTKLDQYNKELPNMIDAVRTNTERELSQLQENLQRLQQDAQTSIQNKHAQLMEPVYKKIAKAIEDVAKENQFTYILTSQIGGLDVILYADDKMDVSDLVLKKMGVTPKPAAAATPQQQPK